MSKNTKVVILAGGLGTRLEEETTKIPKPLVSIGEFPMLWHIMKIYSTHGFHDFIICLGYKGYLIKEYFANYFLHQSDVTFDFSNEDQKLTIHNRSIEPWKVTLVDTGLNSATGGRVKRIEPYIDSDVFMLTYGDAVCDVNLKALAEFHEGHKKIATVTAVRPPGRFGHLQFDENGQVIKFKEKPKGDKGTINGGFFVLDKKVFDYLDKGDATIWEEEPMWKLVSEGQLEAYRHDGFWKCMDTLRDKGELEFLWRAKNCPWRNWE